MRVYKSKEWVEHEKELLLKKINSINPTDPTEVKVANEVKVKYERMVNDAFRIYDIVNAEPNDINRIPFIYKVVEMLIMGLPTTPLTEESTKWIKLSPEDYAIPKLYDIEKFDIYCSERYGAVTKKVYKDGKTTYHNYDRFTMKNINTGFDSIIDYILIHYDDSLSFDSCSEAYGSPLLYNIEYEEKFTEDNTLLEPNYLHIVRVVEKNTNKKNPEDMLTNIFTDEYFKLDSDRCLQVITKEEYDSVKDVITVESN